MKTFEYPDIYIYIYTHTNISWEAEVRGHRAHRVGKSAEAANKTQDTEAWTVEMKDRGRRGCNGNHYIKKKQPVR